MIINPGGSGTEIVSGSGRNAAAVIKASRQEGAK